MDKPTLPQLPGKFRWCWTHTGAKIFEDLRAKKAGGVRRNVAHFTLAVLWHVLEGKPLEGEKEQRRARELQRLLGKWGVL